MKIRGDKLARTSPRLNLMYQQRHQASSSANFENVLSNYYAWIS
jgi:hypothetical protein